MADRDEGKVEKSKKISRQIAGTSKEKRADEKYEKIMEQFGSIEAYQEAKSLKKSTVIKEPKRKEPEGYKGGGSVRLAKRGGGRAYGKNS